MAHLERIGSINIYRNLTAYAFGTFYSSIKSEAEADALPVADRDALLLHSLVVQDYARLAAKLTQLKSITKAPGLKPQADIRKIQDNRVEGSIQIPDASLLLLSMPFDRGWSALLDKEPLMLFQADYGLTAALIPAGSHALMLTFEPPGRKIGIAISLATFVLLIGLWWRDRKRQGPKPS
jgi:uncharacterized membrane protein YfhO